MSKKLKLTKLELETKDGKKVELSLAEAKELHEQLHELFGDKTVYLPSQPVIIDRWRNPYWASPYVTWCDNSKSYSTVQVNTDNLKMTYSCEAA